jgi:hypothetical protein
MLGLIGTGSLARAAFYRFRVRRLLGPRGSGYAGASALLPVGPLASSQHWHGCARVRVRSCRQGSTALAAFCTQLLVLHDRLDRCGGRARAVQCCAVP